MRVYLRNSVHFIADTPDDIVYHMRFALRHTDDATFMAHTAAGYAKAYGFTIETTSPQAFLRSMGEHGIVAIVP